MFDVVMGNVFATNANWFKGVPTVEWSVCVV